MHHAYLYEGEFSLLEALERDARERFNFARAGDPDVHVVREEKFGIEEARRLRDLASLKSAEGRALFIIAASAMTVESQQALLKLFEEPQEGAVFVLLLPRGSAIGTLCSRFLPYPARIYGGSTSVNLPRSNLGRKFLGASQKERSAEIAKLLKDEEGVRERVRAFLEELEKELHPLLKKSSEAREGLEDIAKVRSYVNDRSPALKMLLEHLTLALPKL